MARRDSTVPCTPRARLCFHDANDRFNQTPSVLQLGAQGRDGSPQTEHGSSQQIPAPREQPVPKGNTMRTRKVPRGSRGQRASPTATQQLRNIN